MVAVAAIACDPAASPSASAGVTSSPQPIPSGAGTGQTDPPASGGVPIPAILSRVDGFDVVEADLIVVEGFRDAAGASLGGAGQIGDVVAAKAVREGDLPVEMYAFTVIPAAGIPENDAARLVFDAVAAGAGGEWVAREDKGWFEMRHSGGMAIFGVLGNVPGGFVFALLTGAGTAPVEAVAEGLFVD